MNLKVLKLYECNREQECNSRPYCIKNGGPCHMTKKCKYSIDGRVIETVKATKIKGFAKPIERKNNENR